MGGTEAAGDWFAIGDLGTYCTHRTVALVRPFFGPLPLAPLSLSACLPACLRCDHRIARANSFIHSLSSIHSPTRGETAWGMCWRVWSYALGPRCLTRRGDGVGRVGFYSHLRFVHVGCSVCIGRKQNAEMDNTARLACCPWLTSCLLFVACFSPCVVKAGMSPRSTGHGWEGLLIGPPGYGSSIAHLGLAGLPELDHSAATAPASHT